MWAASDVDILLAESPSVAPPSRWAPVALPAFDWQPSVLVIGRDLPVHDRKFLEKTGLVECVATLESGLARMAEARWDVVVVAPDLREETDGLRFVRAFKCSPSIFGASAPLLALRDQYGRTPFVVRPLEGDSQFAVFESASRWFLGNTWAVPLGEAVLRCVRRR
ncbi:MAG: hypothetical protein Q8L48_30280 [Archangium sp.]|nr:hypothetical protein [Archangium sp.]